jgi:hypothetical protein
LEIHGPASGATDPVNLRYVVFECERCEVDRSGENLTSSIPLFLSKINNKFTQ